MIVTHCSPDLDAIGSTWLLKRYHPACAEALIGFTAERSPDAEVFASALAVCDTGGVYDPSRLRFDHHQDPALPSATSLVYDWLLSECGADISHLAPLIALIDDGDNGRPGASQSYEVGIHALLSARLALYPGEHYDAWLYTTQMLDAIDGRLRHAHEARKALAQYVEWVSDDGKVWALNGDPYEMQNAAAECGAVLIVWHDTWRREGGIAHSVGCRRVLGHAAPHVGELVAAAQGWAITVDHMPLYEEFSRWFRHPQGFMAGDGSPKATPRRDAPAVSIALIAQVISAAWNR